MSSNTNTVLLIDDHALFRRGVAQLIEMDPEFTVVGEASSGPEGVEMAVRLTPDVILVDLNMPQVSGIATLELMRQAGVNSRIVMLTVSDSERDVVAALRAGAQGYLLKDMNPEDLCPSLKKVLSGKPALSEAVTGSLVHALSAGQRMPVEPSGLTARELEVLDYLVAGLSNKAIARKLDISVGTVKVHVKHMLHKLDLHSRLEAVVWRHEHSARDH
ncbi:response regulator protein [Caballeronia choica]|jgi:two-component system, NarL family, nitrate/nitrite response regulator NarL|uniref:Response regulator protein n=1 Tax=Caballeronia choica TaxID=326476 RepID=A0A158I0L2_9BURK|nr:two-component system response regulator NarL [Caballeronia choica]SAL49560.1 response regulator protein [Caballeronia choica]